MSAAGIMTKRGTPIAERVIQATLYIGISGLIIFYCQGWISDIIDDTSMELPVSNELAVKITSWDDYWDVYGWDCGVS